VRLEVCVRERRGRMKMCILFLSLFGVFSFCRARCWEFGVIFFAFEFGTFGGFTHPTSAPASGFSSSLR